MKPTKIMDMSREIMNRFIDSWAYDLKPKYIKIKKEDIEGSCDLTDEAVKRLKTELEQLLPTKTKE